MLCWEYVTYFFIFRSSQIRDHFESQRTCEIWTFKLLRLLKTTGTFETRIYFEL